MCEEQVLLNWFSPEIQLCSGTPNRKKSCAVPPTQLRYNKGARLRRRSHQSRQKLYRNKKKQWKLPTGSRAGVLYNDTELLSRQGARHWASHLLLKKTVRMAIHRLCGRRRSR
jgi:hypothetical protein